jgi:hypothetical protein
MNRAGNDYWGWLNTGLSRLVWLGKISSEPQQVFVAHELRSIFRLCDGLYIACFGSNDWSSLSVNYDNGKDYCWE